ncbi:MAG: hypothetical protein EOO04_15620 [Chitinophagaceae bacterium]|nr:MAG: hypothetical protein EOO04_15620 [Chitinophagaceae bacterium]
MKILIFLSRIALLCNICFIIAEIMRYSGDLQLNPVFSTVVVLGYLSIFLNALLAIAIVIIFVSQKQHLNSFPRWLLIINFLFLIAQIFIFLS